MRTGISAQRHDRRSRYWHEKFELYFNQLALVGAAVVGVQLLMATATVRSRQRDTSGRLVSAIYAVPTLVADPDVQR